MKTCHILLPFLLLFTSCSVNKNTVNAQSANYKSNNKPSLHDSYVEELTAKAANTNYNLTSDFTYICTYNGHKYYLSNFRIATDWYSAKLICEKVGGHLFVFETFDEVKKVMVQLGNITKPNDGAFNERLWIGLKTPSGEEKKKCKCEGLWVNNTVASCFIENLEERNAPCYVENMRGCCGYIQDNYSKWKWGTMSIDDEERHSTEKNRFILEIDN